MVAPSGARYFLLVLVFCLTWSSAFAVGKLAVTVSPPFLFLGLRFLTAALLLIGWCRWQNQFHGLGWRLFLGLMALGVLNQAGYQGITWVGMQTISAGLATIIVSLNPIVIAILAAPILGEPLGWRRWLGLLLGFGGVVLVLRNRVVVSGEDPTGIALVFLALASMVAGTVIFKRWSPRASLAAVIGIQQLGAGLVLLISGLLSEELGAVQWGPTLLGTMLYTVFVVSIGSFALWFYLLRSGSVTAASSLHFLMPPLGLVFGWLLLGETAKPLDLVGVVPIAVGIWLVTREPGAVIRRPRTSRARS